jgi:hypothetical protein
VWTHPAHRLCALHERVAPNRAVPGLLWFRLSRSNTSAMQESNAIERRAEDRKALRVRVAVAVPGRRVLAGHSINVSVSGIRVAVELNLPVATACSISFTLRLSDGSSHAIQSPRTARSAELRVGSRLGSNSTTWPRR